MKKSAKELQASPSILVIGVGNMGSSLVRGLLRTGEGPAAKPAPHIRLFDIHQDRAGQLAAAHHLEALKDLEGPDVLPDQAVVLCIKPQDLAVVAPVLGRRLRPDCSVISILAGVSLYELAEALGFNGPLIRAMPNIPATVGAAATAMCCNDACGDVQKVLAEKIFKTIGDAHWTKESLMDAVTGLSGSGPAYIYMVIEALTDGGVKMGIPRELSAKLATQTVLGSAMLVQATGLHPAILKDQVTTPGGTTIAALHELETHGLRSMLISAVATATERATFLREARKKKV